MTMDKRTAVYPGSFDPVTNGHIDIIERASKIFDKVIVAVANNKSKTPMFSVEDRIEMLNQVITPFNNVVIDSFNGLLMDYVCNMNAKVIIRGLRALSDFEYEFSMALMNRKLNNDVETMFLMTSYNYSFLSSSMIKEVASLGGCIKGLVPDNITSKVIRKAKG